MKYKKVRLDQLNFSSTPVRLRRSSTYMEQLKSSLRATDGPVDPVILRDSGSSEYIIAAGESRVKALIELGHPSDYKVPALLGDFDDRKALEYGLVEEARNALYEGTISLGPAAELHVLLDSPKKQHRRIRKLSGINGDKLTQRKPNIR